MYCLLLKLISIRLEYLVNSSISISKNILVKTGIFFCYKLNKCAIKNILLKYLEKYIKMCY